MFLFIYNISYNIIQQTIRTKTPILTYSYTGLSLVPCLVVFRQGDAGFSALHGNESSDSISVLRRWKN